MRGIAQLSNAGGCMRSNDGHLPRIRAESVERCPQFCHFSKWKREFGARNWALTSGPTAQQDWIRFD
jgi:hypothetical protein